MEGSSNSSSGQKRKRGTGRKKVDIEYIHDSARRAVTFSKRKAGLMKKAFELATLTGSDVMVLVVSKKSQSVYAYTTPTIAPLIREPEGQAILNQCLGRESVVELDEEDRENGTSSD